MFEHRRCHKASLSSPVCCCWDRSLVVKKNPNLCAGSPDLLGRGRVIYDLSLKQIPSGKHTKSYWKWPFIVDLLYHWKWWFSIVCYVYQRLVMAFSFFQSSCFWEPRISWPLQHGHLTLTKWRGRFNLGSASCSNGEPLVTYFVLYFCLNTILCTYYM